MNLRNQRRVSVVAIFVAAIFIASCADAKKIDERIYIIPAGDVDAKVLKEIKRRLPESLPIAVTVEIWPRQEISDTAYDPSRKQYNAEAILDGIYRKITLLRSMETALIVTDVDLYILDLNFVFGVANAPRKTCVISLVRLRNEFYGLKADDNLFLDRAMKEAVHGLGHAWGLEHCANPKCVMSSSNDLRATDKKRSYFCPACQNKVHDRYYSPLFKGKLF